MMPLIELFLMIFRPINQRLATSHFIPGSSKQNDLSFYIIHSATVRYLLLILEILYKLNTNPP